VKLGRRVLAEFLGSLLLAATVIGSGIMAEQLAGGNGAVALLANTAATVTVLGVLIVVLAPVSGAHFNPAVTLVMTFRRELSATEAGSYILVQLAGCCAGALLAHAMFELPLVQAATHIRTGPAQWLAEFVATFGLLFVILGHRREQNPAWLIAAWIGAAYWFTASTSFANPAITLARSLSDTFAGIRPVDVPAFVVAQFFGAGLAVVLCRVLFPSQAKGEHGPEHEGPGCEPVEPATEGSQPHTASGSHWVGRAG
jgi:glycerol uptake facilitator-like aquaporin